jgi:MoxR-like ATPase
MTLLRYEYTGDIANRPESPHPLSPDSPEPYIPSAELIEAVNLAIFLRRPLLLEGEAGCGKTRLARAIAYEFGIPLFRWDVKSSTKAEEGLYRYDALLRLHDVQISQAKGTTKRKPSNPSEYCQNGALGEAFVMSREQKQTSVVLIDEIDKADFDFPNDLLAALDEPWTFKIEETGDEIAADREHLPIVIITSNREKKDLPIPFLRRCVYHFVEFPKPDRLKQIVEAHYQQAQEDAKKLNLKSDAEPSPELIESALERFLDVRKEKWSKMPGTSEFLDWLSALQQFGKNPFDSVELKTIKNLPYRELLFKRLDDWRKAAITT